MSDGIQREPVAPALTYCGGAGDLPGVPSPTGPGGNTTIVNHNEKAITDASFQNVPIRRMPDDMWSENDDYVQGIYREADVGGS